MISNQLQTIYLPTIKWENNLSIAHDANLWTQICKNISSHVQKCESSVNTIQNTSQNTHYTGNRLAKMGFTSEVCTDCNHNSTDTYIHATWHCTPIKHFWEEVTQSLSTIVSCHITLSPSLCLLGDLTIITDKTINSKMLLIALTIAKKTILMNWKTH